MKGTDWLQNVFQLVQNCKSSAGIFMLKQNKKNERKKFQSVLSNITQYHSAYSDFDYRGIYFEHA